MISPKIHHPRPRSPSSTALRALLALTAATAPSWLSSGCANQHYYIQGHVDVIISDSPFPVTPDPAWFSKDANR